MSTEFILEMKGITKTFPGVRALDDVSLQVRKGTVHALMGENGAGKSTLMKVAIGIHGADSGQIFFDGREIDNHDIKSSISLGISMIHQELSPIPHMTVAENIWLGREPMGRIFIDKKKMLQMTRELFTRLGIDTIDPRSLMVDLSIAKTQMVEIAKAISYNAKLIIMDEPTSAITDKEVDHLFRIVNEQKAKDVAFIFITHKMDEVFRIADEITVFRDGRFIRTESAANLNRDKLIEMMVGREITHMFPKEEAEIGDVVLKVENLTAHDDFFRNVSFDLRRGEILGIAGLMGAGRTEVVETLFGYRKAASGRITFKGKIINIRSPRDAVRHKFALLTEDRKLTGLFLPLSVRDNMIVCSIGKFLQGLALNRKKIETVCTEQKNILAVKTPSLSQLVKNLSGGNQQKVLVARWLLTEPEVFIVDEPTRGIDVGAKAEIHRLLSQLAKQGKAVIMISSEMPEILGMSDRVVVMHEGRVTGVVDRAEATQTRIMEYATGGVKNRATA